MNGIWAIDAWCNPFDEKGIRAIFIDNEEVFFMMGEQWGRTENMKGYTVPEFVAQMDALAQRIAPPERVGQRLRDPANHRDLQGEPPIIDERRERFGMTQQSGRSLGQIADAA